MATQILIQKQNYLPHNSNHNSIIQYPSLQQNSFQNNHNIQQQNTSHFMNNQSTLIQIDQKLLSPQISNVPSQQQHKSTILSSLKLDISTHEESPAMDKLSRNHVEQVIKSTQNRILVYILFLDKNKLFIGQTDSSESLQRIINDHKQGKYSWTAKYKILENVEPIILQNQQQFIWQKYFYKLAKQYGYENIKSQIYNCQKLVKRDKTIIKRALYRIKRKSIIKKHRIKKQKPLFGKLKQQIYKKFTRVKTLFKKWFS